ncbi:MAG: selenocysteine lyase [Bacteroidetes bacterium HGW-Bacteroidetes-16]|jgi:selenocysteine lyase/cysteine desulfurase|nr:MAG: selenocysteine lyase [Bacteroidetes bacterium HGW-Bacteroidetes-16]
MMSNCQKDLKAHFAAFRKHIIGDDLMIETPFGKKKMIYADWIASGRLYRPIEEKIANQIGPFVANTHTGTTETASLMTKAYHKAHETIKKHVGANQDDVIITAGFGMTSVINKLQRILGLRSCSVIPLGKECIADEDRPVVFITHMEHHSNHTSWIETIADVVVLQPDEGNNLVPDELRKQLDKYAHRKMKIGSFTACSNVTGVEPPYYELAEIMHEHGGLVFIDFAGSAPYVDINMHPGNTKQALDAIFFSPHKFLGGPGSSGVVVFNKHIYHCQVPDHPGGGTVEWTNPWGGHKYYDDIELREDGGTPGFLQAIRIALAIELKNQLNTQCMRERESQLVKRAFEGFSLIPGIHILAENDPERLGIFSFWSEKMHFNLIVKLLNDQFGVQVRGGCACAGTYGHFLLNVSPEESQRIVEKINSGNLSEKPGFVRVSLHPTMTDEELEFIIDAVNQITANYTSWSNDYTYDQRTNEFQHIHEITTCDERIRKWFSLEEETINPE